ncbi:putative translation initiation factor eif-2b subunit family protein [Phaeomoniella chlamydospora]|uniref:Putative translation initiation factor eif-2b subunit family protein n=1 Tax=Phaeomoniella chlamydospora TaxID=158046 RepID=A0A0G2DYD8_PHACM|nr:putative translation initiation factor eif-2b subunit family protein [Phaeomoniella chlamydospora]
MANTTREFKHRDVVSNFLFKTVVNQGNNKETLVALFKRSHHPDLHTYQGKLAPISGSIDASDANPLAAAIREIREETHLVTDKDLSLGFCGKPFSFADEKIGRSWTVYPFGWKFAGVSAESSIQIDWEHSGWEWVQPEQVLSGAIEDKCVPNLDKSLRRVYFGPLGLFPGNTGWITPHNAAGKTFLSGLFTLKTDNENGARVLATKALECLQKIVKDFGENISGKEEQMGEDSEWWTCLRVAAWQLIYSGRPSMNAAISSAILKALRGALPKIHTGSMTGFQEIESVLSQTISERSASSTKISKAFESYISSLENWPFLDEITIVTLSSSSTIRASILHLLASHTNLKLQLHILESRPLCEGASLAASLITSFREISTSDLGRLKITIIPDTHITHIISTPSSSARILLLGADRISRSGNVSNKMGSLSAAIICRTLCPDMKIVVCSETDKIAKPSSLSIVEKITSMSGAAIEEESQKEMQEHLPESNDAKEVTRVWEVAGAGKDVLETLTLSSKTRPGDVEAQGTTAKRKSQQVKVENIYFEWVPAKYIDAYVSDEGVIGRQEIWDKSLEIGRLEEEVFGQLYGDD